MEVTPQVLADAAKRTALVGEGIALNLARLLNEIELQAPAIQGSAGAKFFGKADEIRTELDAVLDALTSLADKVQASSGLYGDTDLDSGSLIDKVTDELPNLNRDVINALGG